MTRPEWINHPVIAWIRLCRPLILFISMFGASVGALNVTIAEIPVNAAYVPPSFSLIFALLGAALLSSGLMVHNDVTDFGSDVVNRPHKPLPAGVIGKGTARWTGLAMMVSSIFLGGLTTAVGGQGVNWLCAGFTFTIVVVGILYNRWGKYWGVWGHVFVAYGVGAIPLWGAWAVRPGDPWLMAPLALAIFIMEIGREIMVCAGDIVGDIAAGFRTTPVRLGRLTSMWVALGFYILSAPLYPAPRFGWFRFPAIFGNVYLAGAIAFLAILFVTWWLTFRVARKGGDDGTWIAFERYIRTGTRLGVVMFQIILFIEAFV